MSCVTLCVELKPTQEMLSPVPGPPMTLAREMGDLTSVVELTGEELSVKVELLVSVSSLTLLRASILV